MAKWILSAFADEADKMLSGQLKALRENGIHLIELRGVDGKSCSDLTDEEIREIRAHLDGEGVGLSALGSPYGKYPIDEDFSPHRDAFKRGLDIAAGLGTDKIRMFSFFIPKEGKSDPAAWRGKVLDQLSEMLDLAKPYEITLCHENEKGIYGDTDARCEDILSAFDGRMGCVFDPANFIQCGVYPEKAYDLLKDRITYMHIKDAMMADGAVVPAGKGDGKVGDILSKLSARDGDVVLTIEPHLSVFDGLKNLQSEELTRRYTYPDTRTAFDAAVAALRDLL
ncbi:MAG: sugar phosphate isomerase/epimerase [Clostridia bacterium]|nr:sugar phosphate isomerase/epimerase [Clostridia bacterium]